MLLGGGLSARVDLSDQEIHGMYPEHAAWDVHYLQQGDPPTLRVRIQPGLGLEQQTGDCQDQHPVDNTAATPAPDTEEVTPHPTTSHNLGVSMPLVGPQITLFGVRSFPP